MPKKNYTANDPTFVDGVNKIIHLKDRMGYSLVGKVAVC